MGQAWAEDHLYVNKSRSQGPPGIEWLPRAQEPSLALVLKGSPLVLWVTRRAAAPTAVLQGVVQCPPVSRSSGWLCPALRPSSLSLTPGSAHSSRLLLFLSPRLTHLCLLSAHSLTLDFPVPFSVFASRHPFPQMEGFLGAADTKPGVIITHTRNNPESCWAHIRA